MMLARKIFSRLLRLCGVQMPHGKGRFLRDMCRPVALYVRMIVELAYCVRCALFTTYLAQTWRTSAFATAGVTSAGRTHIDKIDVKTLKKKPLKCDKNVHQI